MRKPMDVPLGDDADAPHTPVLVHYLARMLEDRQARVEALAAENADLRRELAEARLHLRLPVQ